MSKLNFEKGLKYLSKSDEILRRVISNLKPQKPDQREPNDELLKVLKLKAQLEPSGDAEGIYEKLSLIHI